MEREKETLIDLVMKNGRLMKKVLKNGEETLVPVEEENDQFKDTKTVPNDWNPQTACALVPPDDPLTKDQHVNRSMRIEALLVKAISPRMKDGKTETIDTGGNSALKELLKDLCKAMGGPWLEYTDKIK